MVNLVDVALRDVNLIMSTPSRTMDVCHRKGSLIAGNDAMIVLFDGKIHIRKPL